MFWDHVAGVYDIFANFINRKTHRVLREKVSGLIGPEDDVLECACGTGLLSTVIAPHCHSLMATDFSRNMLKQTAKKCRGYGNVKVEEADILHLNFADQSFDKVVAGNVFHLLDEPYTALSELARVCKHGGKLIIPTYMNKNDGGRTNRFAGAAEKAGAGFKRQFTFETYKTFFREAGYTDGEYTMIEGRIPCAIAIITRK